MIFVVCLIALVAKSLATSSSIPLSKCQINCDLNDSSEEQPISRLQQGVPGKRGPTGPQGLVGPPGSTGRCSCDIEDDLRTELEELKKSLNALVLPVIIKDCTQFSSSKGDAVSDIYPYDDSFKVVRVMCHMSTDPGGWTIIQRRFDGSQNFFLDWEDYAQGFGQADGEYWIGLDVLHLLTKSGNTILRIELEDQQGNLGYATYSSFIVGPKQKNYKLEIGGYEGNIGDSLAWHNTMMFSARDQDNDIHATLNCAEWERGGWWYKNCDRSNLNGDYDLEESWAAVIWHSWKGKVGLKSTTMMVRKPT